MRSGARYLGPITSGIASYPTRESSAADTSGICAIGVRASGFRSSAGNRFLALSLLVRTWNVFHGNAFPPRRHGYLREMIELVCHDRPDVVCLQEIPVWGVSRLERWSSMQVFPVVSRGPRVPRRIGTPVTRLNQGFFRSAFVGQANAVLVASSLEAEDRGHTCISDAGRERRVVQVVRIAHALVVANLHANGGSEVARLEIERARTFAESVADSDDVVVVAGDFNLSDISLPGYSEPVNGIDHVLVRGAPSFPPVVWPRERRMHGKVVLSDHAPVEVTIETTSVTRFGRATPKEI